MNVRILSVSQGTGKAEGRTILTVQTEDNLRFPLFLSAKMVRNLRRKVDGLPLIVLCTERAEMPIESHKEGEQWTNTETAETGKYKQSGLHFTGFPDIQWEQSVAFKAAVILAQREVQGVATTATVKKEETVEELIEKL